ncbi:sensor histidine kinase, partial [Pedobacter sp.]|uniref:sensor histidine kinase n=1 Tax=Pedobacter sp. TaxID=1411316 RepID=UPI003D7FCC48
ILEATIMAQEKERAEISSTLHDSICQILYGIRLNLQSFQIKHKFKDELSNVNQLLEQAIKDTRQMSYELTPSVLKNFGFTAGINEIAQRLNTPNFHIKCNIPKAVNQLPADVQLYLFRIIQELINNTIKHAKASVAEIKIVLNDQQIMMSVSDNGTGFDPNSMAIQPKGAGLSGIKNKVFLLDGEMLVNSTTHGTTTIIKFKNVTPLDDI